MLMIGRTFLNVFPIIYVPKLKLPEGESLHRFYSLQMSISIYVSWLVF